MLRLVLLSTLVLLPATAQDYYDHRVAARLGALVPAAGSDTSGFDSAPALGFLYSYRFSRYGSFDAGADVAFASRDSAGTTVYIPSVGYRVILPLWDDRIEGSLGFGGAYTFFKRRVSQESWLVYGELAGNYALDLDRKVRAGAHVRWYRDPVGRPVQQWISVGAGISYSFGR